MGVLESQKVSVVAVNLVHPRGELGSGVTESERCSRQSGSPTRQARGGPIATVLTQHQNTTRGRTNHFCLVPKKSGIKKGDCCDMPSGGRIVPL